MRLAKAAGDYDKHSEIYAMRFKVPRAVRNRIFGSILRIFEYSLNAVSNGFKGCDRTRSKDIMPTFQNARCWPQLGHHHWRRVVGGMSSRAARSRIQRVREYRFRSALDGPAYNGYCFAGLRAFVPAAGFLSFVGLYSFLVEDLRTD